MEQVIKSRTYRGYVIETVLQDSGNKSYDVRDEDGHYHATYEPSVRVAKAEIDAMTEKG